MYQLMLLEVVALEYDLDYCCYLSQVENFPIDRLILPKRGKE